MEALSGFPDPRTAQGTRYPLVGLLAAAVCAVIAGATSFAAIADWLDDLDDRDRARLGFTGRVPRASTIWRLMTRLEADLLATTLARWLAGRLKAPAAPRPKRHRIIIAVDGKTMRGVHRPDGTKVHLLSALDTSTGIVLAQVTVDTKSNEIPAFTPLLDAVEQVLGSLEGLVFVADALHTQTSHANELATRGAHLLIPVKGNQKNLFSQLKALPWAEVPVGDRRRDHGHGRKETRTVKTLTVALPGGIHFPHAQQAVRITRTRTVKGKTTRETLHYTVSLPAEEAQPADLQDWARKEWLIEALHHIRDVTFREDLSQARTGSGPAVLATLRNSSIGFHHSNGETNIARATRRANRRSHDLIANVTSGNLRTQ
jgi:predicted transposase YbfD/YdcC